MGGLGSRAVIQGQPLRLRDGRRGNRSKQERGMAGPWKRAARAAQKFGGNARFWLGCLEATAQNRGKGGGWGALETGRWGSGVADRRARRGLLGGFRGRWGLGGGGGRRAGTGVTNKVVACWGAGWEKDAMGNALLRLVVKKKLRAGVGGWPSEPLGGLGFTVRLPRQAGVGALFIAPLLM